jgi:hypothetical protein
VFHIPDDASWAGYKVLNPTIVDGNRVRSQFDLLFLAKWGERRRYRFLINHREVIPSSATVHPTCERLMTGSVIGTQRRESTAAPPPRSQEPLRASRNLRSRYGLGEHKVWQPLSRYWVSPLKSRIQKQNPGLRRGLCS